MLIIVHDWNIEGFLQTVFDIEAFWCLNIFQIDTTESRSNFFDSIAEFFRVFLVNLYIKNVNTTVNLEQ